MSSSRKASPHRIELPSSRRAFTHFGGRLLQMRDEECRRLARELHSTTGQNLAALQMNLSLLAQSAEMLDDPARRALTESLALAEKCTLEIRRLSYSLHPPLLDEIGLIPALRTYAAEYAKRTGIDLELQLPPAAERFPQEVEIGLFRIAQEGLANIQRHSGSPTATLRLLRERDLLWLELIDHGRGMRSSPIGMGIAEMRERARQLGGRLTIKSGGAGGTTLRVMMPFSAGKCYPS